MMQFMISKFQVISYVFETFIHLQFSSLPATWVNRCSEDLECLDLEDEQPLAQLSSMQTDKMTLFFTELLDHDRDDVIIDTDFDQFFEVGRYQHCGIINITICEL